ncbi:MAG: RICIN domain-containing protein [Actinobacteria bacterium]|nr:RICIN domain-containing protein [Actinomycetota bacterium]
MSTSSLTMMDAPSARPTTARFRRWTVIGLAITVGSALAIGAASASPVITPDSPVMYMSVNSPKVMDIPGASHTAGTQLVQWEANGGDNQHWKTLPFATVGEIKLVVIQSVESGLVLDVAGGSTADGAAVVQNTWSGALSQIWWVPHVGGYELMVNMGSGKVLDVAGASNADGAPLMQWTWNGGLNQLWFPTVAVD